MTDAAPRPTHRALNALLAAFGFKRGERPREPDSAALEALCPRYDDTKERAWIESAHPTQTEQQEA